MCDLRAFVCSGTCAYLHLHVSKFQPLFVCDFRLRVQLPFCLHTCSLLCLVLYISRAYFHVYLLNFHCFQLPPSSVFPGYLSITLTVFLSPFAFTSAVFLCIALSCGPLSASTRVTTHAGTCTLLPAKHHGRLMARRF